MQIKSNEVAKLIENKKLASDHDQPAEIIHTS